MTTISDVPLAIYLTGFALTAFLFLHRMIRCPDGGERRLARWTDATIENIGGALLHGAIWPLLLVIAFLIGPGD